jgi:hypothetical protein
MNNECGRDIENEIHKYKILSSEDKFEKNHQLYVQCHHFISN